MNIFKLRTEQDTGALVEKQRANVAAAEREIREAEKRFQSVVDTAVDESEGSNERVLGAHRALIVARDKKSAASALLAKAEALHAESVERRSAKELEERWKRAEALEEKRTVMGAKLSLRAKELAEDFKAFHRLSVEFWSSIPDAPNELNTDLVTDPLLMFRHFENTMLMHGFSPEVGVVKEHTHDGMGNVLRDIQSVIVEGNDYALKKNPRRKHSSPPLEIA